MFIGSNKDDDYIYSAEYSVNFAACLRQLLGLLST